MSDAAGGESKEPAKQRTGKNKRSLTFAEMLESKNFSVPDEAYKLYRSLKNPLAQFVQQLRAAGLPEMTLGQLQNLVNASVGYHKLRLECLETIAKYSHSKPKDETKRADAPAATPPNDPKKPDPNNPYADMTTEQLIAGLPTTDEHFDTGPSSPGS